MGIAMTESIDISANENPEEMDQAYDRCAESTNDWSQV